MYNSQSELPLTIYSMIAQWESQCISENVKWGIKRKMEKGKFTLPYSRFLGYHQGKDGKPEITKREARIIREIYLLFLDGVSINRICKYLMRLKRKTPGGGAVWHYDTVLSILTNEKYAGIAILQKTYVKDFLNHISVVNNDQSQYLVQPSHPAIIPLGTFLKTQQELKRRDYKIKFPIREETIKILEEVADDAAGENNLY